jgi:hypothetical protein
MNSLQDIKNTPPQQLKVGDLVKFRGSVGVVACIDPEEIGDTQEVEVSWSDGDVGNMSCGLLEVINANR